MRFFVFISRIQKTGRKGGISVIIVIGWMLIIDGYLVFFCSVGIEADQPH